MKTKRDPRHLSRIKIVQELFASTFQSNNSKLNPRAKAVWQHVGQIDKIIAKHAPTWPIAQIAPIDLAILRLAIWELIYDHKNPVKVVIDEAIEIAKSYGSDTSGAFVNGVLGSVVTEKKL